MKDEQTILVIQSINLNDNLSPGQKLELTSLTMKDCQQKKIGKIITDAIKKQPKSKLYYPEGPLKKQETKDEIVTPVKRGRGRPRKTENQKALVNSVKADSEGRY